MSQQVRITILMENDAARPDLETEHGLAYGIETPDTVGLFDTGQSDKILHNAAQLNWDWSRVQWIALSHGHYDHGGGLAAVLQHAPQALVYAHPAAFAAKLSVDDKQQVRDIGMPIDDAVTKSAAADLVLSEGGVTLGKGVRLTGEIPRTCAFEKIPERFQTYLNGNRVQEEFPDDQSMLIDTAEGTIVLLGCAHSGIINILQRVETLTNTKSIRALIGGLHLSHASAERIEATVKALRQWDIAQFYPNHCTGEAAIRALGETFPKKVFPAQAGTILEF